jgi:hypothetical protein
MIEKSASESKSQITVSEKSVLAAADYFRQVTCKQ